MTGESVLRPKISERDASAIRVFVIDDSNIVRMVFSRLVAAEPGLQIAGAASSAEEALEQIGALDLDIILLDLEMPGMGGMRALPAILRRAGKAKVLIVSTLTAGGADATLKALSLGAADTLQKPVAGAFDQIYKDRLVEKIRLLALRPSLRDSSGNARPDTPTREMPMGFRARAIGIGASTGGIQATVLLLAMLPREIDVPILITQHLPADFSLAYARQLREAIGRPVSVAQDGVEVTAGTIMIAPGDAHLCVERASGDIVVRLNHEPSLTGCRPSVDAMFSSMAKTFGNRALGVCLTGMGRDGTYGAQELVAAGSHVIVQNEASSVVWGMPGAIAKAGLASAVLQPSDMAAHIANYAASL